MVTTNTTELRALAEAVGHGDWYWDSECSKHGGGHLQIPSGGTWDHNEAATAFIAAASPDVVLALLDRIAELEKWGSDYGTVAAKIVEAEKRIDSWTEECRVAQQNSDFWRDKSEKAEAALRESLDAIWRLTNLPFTDNDRHMIQGIALAYLDGGPKPGSQVEQWMAALGQGGGDRCPQCGEDFESTGGRPLDGSTVCQKCVCASKGDGGE